MRRPTDNAAQAFGTGDYAQTVRLLRPIRRIAHRFGGSNAQRDLLDLTLIEAAFRAGERPLAAALVAERREVKSGPFTRALSERAGISGRAV